MQYSINTDEKNEPVKLNSALKITYTDLPYFYHIFTTMVLIINIILITLILIIIFIIIYRYAATTIL